MWRSRPGSCWGWSWCGEPLMVEQCQSGRTDSSAPMIPGAAPGSCFSLASPPGLSWAPLLSHRPWGSQPSSPCSPRAFCAGCDLISGALLSPGSPTLCTALRQELLVPPGERQLLLQSWGWAAPGAVKFGTHSRANKFCPRSLAFKSREWCHEGSLDLLDDIFVLKFTQILNSK